MPVSSRPKFVHFDELKLGRTRPASRRRSQCVWKTAPTYAASGWITALQQILDAIDRGAKNNKNAARNKDQTVPSRAEDAQNWPRPVSEGTAGIERRPRSPSWRRSRPARCRAAKQVERRSKRTPRCRWI
jgi:hypothetical protein